MNTIKLAIKIRKGIIRWKTCEKRHFRKIYNRIAGVSGGAGNSGKAPDFKYRFGGKTNVMKVCNFREKEQESKR